MSDVATSRPQLERLLKPHGQEHLLRFWDTLDRSQRNRLTQQIAAIDFDLLARLYGGAETAIDWADLARRAAAPPAFRLDGKNNRFSAAEARRRGEASLAAGKVAAILVAGGQGSRLGFEHPKGMFPIGPVSQAPLFQILFEKLVAVGRRYGAPIPLFLMTSPATHEETIEFLVAHDRFGLPAEDLHVFCQGTMPAVDASSGRVLLSSPGEIFTSPDGHGGMLAALDRSGSLAELERRGAEELFYFQVDNPLVQVCDPEFIGYHLLSDSELSTQVVAKRGPDDRMGNVVAVDGQVSIIEYSDLPREAGERRLPDGSLELWAGSVAVHVFDRRFLERVKNDQRALPFHVARKQVPYIDDRGRRIESQTPNAIKFERFIFDLLPAAANAIVVEVDRARTFAAVKNGSGAATDTRETVQAQMMALHREWLEQAGATVSAGVAVEISPLAALDAEEAARKFGRGLHITEPTFFGMPK
jgi:UDP-N-acetylglucosamine/UDP-N-acetylgalactosamine diphosphorylase